MHKIKKVVMVSWLICIVMMSIGLVIAKQQKENGNANGDTDRLRDCTCNDHSCESFGDQVPDRLRDGSCMILVADKKQDMVKEQLKLKDGSCKL